MQLKLRGVRKRFGENEVLRGIDLTVRGGEVVALLGENGAGKSTLSNVFTGLYRADEGHLEVDGVPVAFTSPRDAIDAGIGDDQLVGVPELGEDPRQLGVQRSGVLAHGGAPVSFGWWR